LVKKLSSVCYVMRKLSYILKIDTLRIVHFAHFQLLINYGISFWVSSSTMHKVFLIQKRIIRIMLCLGPRHTNSFKSIYFCINDLCC
jgi:lipoprotein signal peptidase